MNKPEIIYYDNGQKEHEIYRNNEGFYHRKDGPAYIYWNENGQKCYEEYWINGKYHRKDGPAVITWYNNVQKRFEIYYIDNKLHREDGPAYIDWYENGQKENEEYWIDGIQLDKFEIRKLKLKKLNIL